MRISFYNENTSRNAMRIDINNVTFYFSYNTLVWIRLPYNGNEWEYQWLYTIKNYWQQTTGKHLNWIDWGDKKDRLDQEAFGKVAKYAIKISKVGKLPELNIN